MIEQEVERFTAKSDDGERFTVIVYQSYASLPQLAGNPVLQKGLRRLALSDGRAVNELDAETFKIVETNQFIRKVG